MKATVFLGGGRITSTLIAGLRLAKYNQPIIVRDLNPHKLRELNSRYGVGVESNLQRAVEQAQLLIIAVRPDSVSGLLRDIGKTNRPLHIVSLAAGVPLAKLQAALGSQVRWARAMPSPVCRSSRGLTALTFEKRFSAAKKKTVKDLFGSVGAVLEIPESKFDAFTVTYSCSHGYHALATLAAASEKMGLDRKSALTAAAHALADGILAWRNSKTPLDTLLREAATPGGIAAAVMESMDAAGYKRAIERGLAAGMKRAQRNAKRS